MDKMFKETDVNLNKASEMFTGQWGKLIESLAECGILKVFQERGIKITELARRVESHKSGGTMEVDFLLTNASDVIVGEVKTTMKSQDVKDFLDDLDRFLLFFPRYRGYRIYGAMIGLNIEEDSDRFGYKNGLFVLKLGGEGLVRLLNDVKFKPRDFGTQL